MDGTVALVPPCSFEPLQALPEVHDEDLACADVLPELDLELTCKDALATLTRAAGIPVSLSDHFRVDVMGTGTLVQFAPLLKMAVEQRVEWRGQSFLTNFLRLADWSPDDCAIAWAAASDAERNRWRVMVTDMRKVYCMIREYELGQITDPVAWRLVDGVMRDGFRASFSAVRRVAMKIGDRRRHAYSVCQTLVRTVCS